MIGPLRWFLATNRQGVSPRLRALWLLGAIVALFFGLQGRLYSLQVLHHDEYVAKRDKASTRTIQLPGERGAIVTQDGVALARTTFSGASIIVNPRAVPAQERMELALRLARLLERDDAFAQRLNAELYNRRDKYFYCVQRECDTQTAARIKAACAANELPGVEVRSIESREYPLGNFAAHVVGFVGGDQRGLEGVERLLDPWLAGRPGQRVTPVDALARPLPGARDEITEPVQGASVELTIHAAVQAIVEEELRALVDRWDPVSVAVVVMETHSGAVLGMANYPSFDPNNPGSDPASRRNIAITDAFEPGSVFKPLIVCAAYQQGLLTPDSILPYTPILSIPGRRKAVSDGTHPIPQRDLVRMADDHWGAGVEIGLVKSSNTQMTRIGLMLTPDRLQPFLVNCGFGQRTGFDLGGSAFGESPGRLKPLSQWSVSNSIPSVCMGYEVQVTALQMLNSFNIIASGGVLYKPYVVQRVMGHDGEVLFERRPQLIRETGLSQRVTRELMNETLKRVVSGEGTAKGAQIAQYRIAGKTGTAHKVKNGGYSDDKICSFVGYAPADNPRLTVIVTVNEARARVLNQYGYPILHFGGTVAAPTMSRIMLRSLKQLGVPEDAPATGR